MELQWKTLKKKLAKTNRATLAIGLVFVFIGVCMFAANAQRFSMETPEPVFFDDTVELGYPAYADVILLELYAGNDKDEYYLYADETGQIGIIMLNGLRWDDAVETLLAADDYVDTVRIEGIARDLPSDIVNFLREDDFQGLPVNRVTYLSAGQSWTDDTVAFLIIGAFLLLIFGLLAALSRMSGRTLARCKRNLEEKNLLDEAIRQFDSTRSWPAGAAVSQDFVYGLGSGVLLHAEDIFWVYMRTRRQRYGQVFFDLMVADRKRRHVLCTVRKQDQTSAFNEIAATMQERNPNMLLGHSQENEAAYRNMTR